MQAASASETNFSQRTLFLSLAISAVKSFFHLMTTQPSLATDPVCGMTVDPAKAKATAEHAGQKYYFCCAGCAQKFRSNPEQYLKPKPALVSIDVPTLKPKPQPLATETPASTTTRRAAAYVCPMCPEV